MIVTMVLVMVFPYRPLTGKMHICVDDRLININLLVVCTRCISIHSGNILYSVTEVKYRPLLG